MIRTEEVDMSSFFVGAEGTFVVLEPRRGLRRVFNLDRAKRPFIPASTFKIPNTLIALETGVVDGPDFALPWDANANPAASWWPRSWRRDQVLHTAFRNSVYWFYQELARRIGEDRMREHLRRFRYGNESMGGGLDRFWLHGDLRISALEQVEFLQGFYSGELGLSDRTVEIVREMMVLRQTPRCRLGGKTGTAEVSHTSELGWLVGYVECGESVAFYALNLEGERVWEDWPPQERADLVVRLLGAIGIAGDLSTRR